MTGLDGEWLVRRESGLLPPLIGVRKMIRGDRGETRLGFLPGVPFRVSALLLRYEWPFWWIVDELEPAGEGFRGRATFRGREVGRFSKTPRPADRVSPPRTVRPQGARRSPRTSS